MCGAKTWHQLAFAEGQRQITKTLEAFIERQLTRLTIQDVLSVEADEGGAGTAVWYWGGLVGVTHCVIANGLWVML
jgi:hypothetical protein